MPEEPRPAVIAPDRSASRRSAVSRATAAVLGLAALLTGDAAPERSSVSAKKKRHKHRHKRGRSSSKHDRTPAGPAAEPTVGSEADRVGPPFPPGPPGLLGPTGPTGPPGLTGATGPATRFTITKRNGEIFQVVPDRNGAGNAVCNPGEIAIGGGAFNFTLSDCNISSSFAPAGTTDTWRIIVFCATDSRGAAVTPQVVCLASA